MQELCANNNTRLVEDAVESTHRHREVCAITGRTGVGKTYATKIIGRGLADDFIYLALSRKSSRKELTVRLLRQLRRSGALPSGEMYRLEAEITDELTDRSPMVVVDEAHGLDDVALDHIAHLHGRSEWTLILLGSPKLAVTLAN